MAVICLLMVAMFVLQQALPRAFNFVLFLAVFALAYAIRWMVMRVKERSTYPRTGYVAYKSGWENRGALAVTVAFTILLLALMFFLALQGPQTVVWTPAVGGLIFAFIFTGTGYRAALPRFYFLALFCLLAGGVLALSGQGDLPGAALLSGLTSLILFAFSGLTRRAYLRQAPPPAEQTDEH